MRKTRAHNSSQGGEQSGDVRVSGALITYESQQGCATPWVSKSVLVGCRARYQRTTGEWGGGEGLDDCSVGNVAEGERKRLHNSYYCLSLPIAVHS